MILRLGNTMLAMAAATFTVATAWWITFFHELLGDRFQIARECFYWTTELCSLKEAGGLISDVPVYQPEVLWVAGGLLVFGLGLRVVGHGHHR